jgi:DNA-binding CsgD family transcriptional regulator
MSEREAYGGAGPEACSEERYEGEAPASESDELSALELVQRLFADGDASAWLVHVATGQVLWVNPRGLERVAAMTAPSEGEGPASIDPHARLVAAHARGWRVREHALTFEGYTLALFVAVARKSAVPAWGRGSPLDARASRTWWMRERGFTPALASVAALLVRGATPEDVARELEITLTSAKTYIQRVRDRVPKSERWWISRRAQADA